jgi:hypothetical protein
VPDLAAETAKKLAVKDDKFADEDEEEEEAGLKKPYGAVKKEGKKVVEYVDETLDDPVAVRPSLPGCHSRGGSLDWWLHGTYWLPSAGVLVVTPGGVRHGPHCAVINCCFDSVFCLTRE